MPDEKPLSEHTVAELDDLAVAHEVEDYPASANKTEKVAALEDAGVGPQPEPVYRFRLKDGVVSANFMADTKRVTLTEAEPTFETTDAFLAIGLRDLDFLEEASE